MRAWVLIVLLAAGSIAMKSLGPLLAGGRHMPNALARVIALLAPALITALVVADTVTSGRQVVIDPRLVGVAVGAVLLWFRAPTVVALALAALSCALIRAAL